MIRSKPLRPAVAVALLAASAMSLAACGRGATKSGRLLSAAMASNAALNAAGEQPFWALQIRKRNLTFSSAKVDSITLVGTGLQAVAHGQMWTGDAGGRPFRATITALACKDAATGLAYPLTAQVEAVGFTYTGCATKAGQGLGPAR